VGGGGFRRVTQLGAVPGDVAPAVHHHDDRPGRGTRSCTGRDVKVRGLRAAPGDGVVHLVHGHLPADTAAPAGGLRPGTTAIRGWRRGRTGCGDRPGVGKRRAGQGHDPRHVRHRLRVLRDTPRSQHSTETRVKATQRHLRDRRGGMNLPRGLGCLHLPGQGAVEPCLGIDRGHGVVHIAAVAPGHPCGRFELGRSLRPRRGRRIGKPGFLIQLRGDHRGRELRAHRARLLNQGHVVRRNPGDPQRPYTRGRPTLPARGRRRRRPTTQHQQQQHHDEHRSPHQRHADQQRRAALLLLSHDDAPRAAEDARSLPPRRGRCWC